MNQHSDTEIVRLMPQDLDRLKYENTIAALQTRNQQLQDLLRDEKQARSADAKKHARVVRELNSQIANNKMAEHIKMLEERNQSLAETCQALSEQLHTATAESADHRRREFEQEIGRL